MWLEFSFHHPLFFSNSFFLLPYSLPFSLDASLFSLNPRLLTCWMGWQPYDLQMHACCIMVTGHAFMLLYVWSRLHFLKCICVKIGMVSSKGNGMLSLQGMVLKNASSKVPLRNTATHTYSLIAKVPMLLLQEVQCWVSISPYCVGHSWRLHAFEHLFYWRF